MKTLKRIGILAVVLLVLVVSYTAYLGAFHPMTVAQESVGPYTLVYREMAGTDLGEIGRITTELDALLSGRGMKDRLPLDMFAPDGHAQVGFAVTGATPEQLAALGNEAHVREVSFPDAIVTRFPRHGRLSFLVGAMKVDPAFAAYRQAHGLVKTEAYALNLGDTILYFQPIAHPTS